MVKKTSEPKRKTSSIFDLNRQRGFYEGGLRLLSHLPTIDIHNHYKRSLDTQGKYLSTGYLRALSNVMPVRTSINQVIDGVIGMKINISPPHEDRKKDSALDLAKFIKRGFMRPNIDEQNTYREFISAIVTDILIGNQAAIERQKIDMKVDLENPRAKPLWLWAVDYERILRNPEWEAQKAGVIPRYFDTGRDRQNRLLPDPEWKELMDDDLFFIRRYTSTFNSNPPAPVQLAFDTITSWLGLTEFQRHTTSKSSQEWMIDLGEVNEKELRAFREFFEVEVIQKGAAPIFGSRGAKGISVVKLGAVNDSGLYLQYQETLLRLIALAFNLTARDMNIVERDNRATAGVAADMSFQKAILPIAQMLIEAFQAEILDLYYPGFQIEFIDSEPRSEEEEANTASMLYEKKIISLNETRLRIGEDEIGKRGEVFFDGSAFGENEAPPPPPEAQAPPQKQSPGTAAPPPPPPEIPVAAQGFQPRRSSKQRKKSRTKSFSANLG